MENVCWNVEKPEGVVDRNRSVKHGKLYAEEKQARVFHIKWRKLGENRPKTMEKYVETVEKACGKCIRDCMFFHE